MEDEILADDAPGDDRVDLALKKRAKQIQRDDVLDNLTRAQAAEMTDILGGVPNADVVGSTWQHVKSATAATAKDVGMGIVETPRQAIGGARDAAQAMIDFGDWAADSLEKVVPLGGIQITNDQGEFDPAYIPKMDPAKTGVTLPEVGDARSNTGGMIRKAAQFLTGFAVGGNLLRGVQATTTAGVVGKSLVQGAFADAAAFDGQEKRLSNFIQEVPALQNPINEYLAADPNDGEAEGRFKNAVEGMGLGVAAEGLSYALRAIRANRIAAAQDPAVVAQRAADGAVATADETTREAAGLSLLGPADGPALSKFDTAMAETATGVPDDVAAKALTDKGLRPLGNSDYYINFNRLDTPEAIQKVIQDGASAFTPEIMEARRGIRTNAQTKADAATIDAWDMLVKRRQGEPLNAEQSVAARELWATSATKLREVAEAAAATPTPENLFEFRRMLAVFHGVQKEVLAARAETARALQSWRIPAGGTRQQMAAIENALNNFGGAEVSQKLAQAVVNADKAGGVAAVSALAEKSVRARTLAAVQEYWINSILSGPKTHVVNAVSNASVMALNVFENAVAARVGKFFGGDDVVMMGEATANAFGSLAAWRDALRNAGKTMRTGETGFGINKLESPPTRAISSTAWNLRSDSDLGRAVDALGAVVNIPGRALQTQDEFFKTMGYRGSLHQQAFRQAAREVASGKLPAAERRARIADIIANPPESMQLDAAAQAAYQTFTSEPGKFVRMANKLRAEVPALRFLMPFVQTPANVFKFVFERTPLAPVMQRYKAAMAKGGAEADLAQTKMAMGTLTMMLAIDLGMNGSLTGSGPANEGERQALMRTGWKPYSVKVGDKYIAYNRMDPIGTLFQFGADLGEYTANTDGSEDEEDYAVFEETFYATVFSVVEAITSKAFLSGLTDITEAISDPKRYGEQYAQRFAGSFIPSAVNEITRAEDPTRRHVATLVDALKNRVPGLSSTLPPRRDLWGREVKYESGIGKMYDALSPLYGSTYKPMPIDKVMLQDGWFLGMPQNYFTVDGEKVSLRNTPKAYSRFLELRGAVKPSDYGKPGRKVVERYGDQPLLDTLNAIVTKKHPMSAAFLELKTADDRADFVKKIVRDYQTAAKAKLFEEFPEIEERAKKKADAKASAARELEPIE